MCYTTIRELEVDRMTDQKDQVEFIEPGAARLGNFNNYYQFNPANERICHIPSDILKKHYTGTKIYGLDIGCNSGVSRQNVVFL